METKHKLTYIFCIILLSLSYGQQDTIQNLDINDVTIIKSYEVEIPDSDPIKIDPVLSTAQFAPPSYDYKISIVPYDVKDPEPQMKPLALQSESLPRPKNIYAKLGYGSMKNPYGYIGYQKVAEDLYDVNITGLYHSLDNSKRIDHQQYREGGLRVHGSYRVFENTYFQFDLDGKYNARKNRNKKNPPLHQYLHTNASLGIQNVERSELGINYKLELGIHRLDIVKSDSETSYHTHVLIDKSILSGLSIYTEANLYTATDDGDLSKAKHTYISARPGLQWKYNAILIRAAYDHTISDKATNPFVDIYGAYAIYEDLIQLYIDIDQKVEVNNHYLRYMENPYFTLQNSFEARNTLSKNFFAGLRSNINNKVTLDARLGWREFENLAFFDVSVDNKEFIQRYLPNIGGMALEATALFYPEEHIHVGASLDFIRYNKGKQAIYNMPTATFGLHGGAHFLDKKLSVSADARLGSQILFKDGENEKNGNVLTELNTEVQYMLLEKVGLWVRANNILNSRYLRYQGNPIAGIHVLGGVTVRF